MSKRAIEQSQDKEPREKKPYRKPELIGKEKMQVLAGTCDRTVADADAGDAACGANWDTS